MKCFAKLAAAVWMLLCLCACKAPEEPVHDRQVFAMDTVMVFKAYGGEYETALEEAEQEMQRLDDLLSRTKEDSEVGRLNSAAGEHVQVGDEIQELLRSAAIYTESTNGAFDITIAPVVAAWGFTTDSYQVPEPAELESLLQTVGMEHVHLDADSTWLDVGTQIDLGGIAKGYASDRVAEIYHENGVVQGTAALGGNVMALGTKRDGTPWRVGVRDPRNSGDANAYAAILNLTDSFAVTSGGYERYFEENGKTYHHILNPATGYPADSGLLSVTVVADCSERSHGNGALCDALSTALFVMGEEQAVEFWRSNGYPFELLLVTEDGRVVVTKGLSEQVEQMEGSGYIYETVS